MTEDNKISMKKQADFVMLNACSTNSNGLYYGKAGIALALFETAKFLDDEYIEDQAFQTFQESLITQSKDISFENGLSGIGYVLLHLIHHDFLEANFNELFEDKLSLIHKYTDHLCSGHIQEKELLNNMGIIYFLDMHYKYTRNDKSCKLKEQLLTECDKILKKLLTLPDDGKSMSKIDFLLYFEKYINIINNCCITSFSHNAIDQYFSSYENHEWISMPILSLSLYEIAERINNIRWKESAFHQMNIALRGVNVERESLQFMIDFLFCQTSHIYYLGRIKEIKTYLFTVNEQKLINNLSRSIPHKFPSASYASGMSRLLLCYINEYTNHHRNNILRPL